MEAPDEGARLHVEIFLVDGTSVVCRVEVAWSMRSATALRPIRRRAEFTGNPARGSRTPFTGLEPARM